MSDCKAKKTAFFYYRQLEVINMKRMVMALILILICGGLVPSCTEKQDIRGVQSEYSFDETKYYGYLVYDHKQKRHLGGKH